MTAPFTGTFDSSCAVLDGDQLYVQVEFKIPHGAPADLSHGNLQALTAAFERGLHRP